MGSAEKKGFSWNHIVRDTLYNIYLI